MKMMEFSKTLREEVAALLPDKDVREVRVVKINDQILHGIVITPEGSAAGPTFYIDEVYENIVCSRSEADTEIKAAAFDMVNAYISIGEHPEEITDLTFGSTTLAFEEVKADLTLRLVEKARNKEYLADKPCRELGSTGLAAIAAISSGNYCATVTNGLAESEGYDIDEVFTTAEANTGASMVCLDALLYGDPENLLNDEAELPEDPGLLMVSPATVLAKESTLKRIEEIIGEGYYVLPSSIHEVMVQPETDAPPIERLKAIVHDANRDVVSKSDILSDNVFHYSSESGLTVVEGGAA